MTCFQYGAFVRARFKLPSPNQNWGTVERYILASGRILPKMVDRSNPSGQDQLFVIKPTNELLILIEECKKSKEKLYAEKNPSKQRSSKNKFDKKVRLIIDCMNRLILEMQDTNEHIAFVAENPVLDVMQFLNFAGKSGWETTGQVPGLPGPTGITMMRKRIN